MDVNQVTGMVPELSLGHPPPRAFEMGIEREREKSGGEGVGEGFES